MTTQVKFDSDGLVVQDTVEAAEPNALSDLYVLMNRDLVKLAEAWCEKLDVNKNGDSDAAKYYRLLDNAGFEGKTLGTIQRYATDYASADYEKWNKVGSSVNAQPASENEQQLIVKGNLIEMAQHEDNKLDWEVAEDVLVPTAPDGEALPALVASNERTEAVHTFEEAEEIFERVMSQIDVADETVDAAETENESSNTSDDSDQTDPRDPTNIPGFGEARVKKARDHGFEIVPSDPEKMDVEPFDFESDESGESDEPKETTSGMPDPDKVMELMDNGWTKDEIQDFYGE